MKWLLFIVVVAVSVNSGKAHGGCQVDLQWCMSNHTSSTNQMEVCRSFSESFECVLDKVSSGGYECEKFAYIYFDRIERDKTFFNCDGHYRNSYKEESSHGKLYKEERMMSSAGAMKTSLLTFTTAFIFVPFFLLH